MNHSSGIVTVMRRMASAPMMRHGRPYLFAVLITLLFFALRLPLQGITENRPMMIMFILPVCFSAYLGGVGPGLVATLISAMLTAYFLIEPLESFAMARNYDYVQLAAFIITGAVVSILSEFLRRARRNAAELPSWLGQLSAIAETMEGALFVWRLSPEGTFEFVETGPGMARLTGLPDTDLLHDASSFIHRIPEQDRALMLRDLEESSERMTPIHRVFPYRHDERGAIWLEAWSYPRRVPGEGVIYNGLIADVTTRKQSEQHLRDSEELYRMYVEQSPVAIMVTNMEGRYIDGNPAAQRIFGFSVDEMKDLHIADLVHEDEQEVAIAHFKRAISSGLAEGEFRMRHKDGHYNHLLVLAKPVAGERVLGYCIDVSARQRAEELARLQGTALQAAANAIVITDYAGRIEWVNPAFVTLMGYPAAEAIGQNYLALIRSGEEDPVALQQLIISMEAGLLWQGELVSRRKNGSTFTGEITMTAVRDDGAGIIRHYVAVQQDVTTRRMNELQLLRTQRLESVGRLASGIAHDLNNILAPVLAAPDLLRDAVTDPDLLSLIDSVESSAKRGAAIVRQLLTFGRGSEVGWTAVSLRPILTEMVEIIRETFPRNIVPRLDVPGAAIFVEGDPTQLHQLLMNLCVNARDAMPGGGSIQIRLERVEVSLRECAPFDWVRPGSFALLTVSDTGTGIPPDLLNKIFDPFFTTKPIGEGTGLGLSTAMSIVRSHDGFIVVDSRVGHGSSFRAYLPLASPEDGGGAVVRMDVPPSAGRKEPILFVDDESSVRIVLGEVLRRAGYAISLATNGAEALEVLGSRHQDIKLLLTDMMMPVMDGWHLIKEVRNRWPSIRIVAISGNLPEVEWLESLRANVDDLILKPCAKDVLLKTVRDVLDRA